MLKENVPPTRQIAMITGNDSFFYEQYSKINSGAVLIDI